MLMRLERDSIGIVEVPATRRYGAQTGRAVANFPVTVTGHTIGDLPALVHALLRIKQAAARANRRCGYLDEPRATLIDQACVALLNDPELALEFPVHILHGGGGTSGNMNANEVIAHTANRVADGGPVVDALDHVNKNQSTNDVYPTACRLSLLAETDRLVEALEQGERTLEALVERLQGLPRLARTCMQDAVGSTFDAFFGAYVAAWRRHHRRLGEARAALDVISLGGGVAGQPGATPNDYRDAVLDELRELVPARVLRSTEHFADAAQNADDLLFLAHALDGLARTLIKQAQDLRFLVSGPEGGIAEIRLPPQQPGSSAIPGKINPVIPEFVIQCGMQTVASATACGLAVEHADLDLNVWEGVFVHNISVALSLMASAVSVFDVRCLRGLDVDADMNRARSDVSTARIAKHAQERSYSDATNALRATVAPQVPENSD